MNTLVKEFLLSEIRNSGFQQEIESLPVGNESGPKSLVWFSMTALNKLGVNPKSQYNTPLGIYCYPLTAKYKEHLLKGTLPFAGNQPYVQLFKIKSDARILNINTYSESEYEQDKKILEL